MTKQQQDKEKEEEEEELYSSAADDDRSKLCVLCHMRPAEIYMWDEIEESTSEFFKAGEKHYEGMICRPCMEQIQEQSRKEQEEMTDEHRELIKQMKEYAARKKEG